MIFTTSDLEGRENYQLLNGGITPRPIAWISTRSKDQIDNLAPFSFFTVASCNPPVLLYTQIAARTGLDKDTLTNLLETGECVVNIVSTELLEKMNKTSASIAANESEFSFADVAACESCSVKPLSVKEAPIRYECALREVITVSDLPTGGKMVLLDVKSVYVLDELLSEGRIDQSKITTVGKLGGDFYAVLPEKVEISRPN
ncbi:flavin reductase family protein [Neptuniibacter sp.]|uniref:flavin reductase family protein n=1 Tax=Neptuniibacter sp. TaxID=1962643 RepID=UPI003B5ABC9B